MAAMQGAISAAERSMRSVFVGNIPYEASEEQLKDIFAEIGPVVSFRLVYDRETGKPKGYGFCEYKDQEMALSAMRNLNGYELNGRALRVDNAASEKSKEELKILQASLGGPPVESPFGPEVDPDKAPEEISKAVASLPPEQMFELMKQMKMCIQNNPSEARNLLLQNPQLAYALLQAQVVMRIVDPAVAMSMLQRQNPVMGHENKAKPQNTNPMSTTTYSAPMMSGADMSQMPMVSTAMHSAPALPVQINPMGNPRASMPMVRPPLLVDPAHQQPPISAPQQSQHNVEMMDSYGDPRMMSDRDMRMPAGDRDMRIPPGSMMDKDMRPLPGVGDQDMRHLPPSQQPQTGNRPYDPRFRGGMQGGDMPGRGQPTGPPFDRQQRSGAPFDPRTSGFDGRNADPRNGQLAARGSMGGAGAPSVTQHGPPSAPITSPRQQSSLAAAAAAIAPHDQEKAQLIMQVLQLSDAQIAMLPAEQRQSILILKEQIARNQH